MEIAGTASEIEQIVGTVSPCGRRDALRQVFRSVGGGVYRFILVRVGGDRDVADDLLQQTCYEAARHRRPPADVDECEAWLRGIARNLVRRHWRSARRDAGRVSIADPAVANRLADDLETRPLPVDALVKEEWTTQLLLAVTSLAAADQELIFAYYFDGRPQAAIASDLGVTDKSVENRLYRARGRLREALRHMGRSGER